MKCVGVCYAYGETAIGVEKDRPGGHLPMNLDPG